MKAAFVFAAVFFSYFIVTAQELIIRNSETKTPIVGVMIYGVMPNSFLISDEDGKADLTIFNRENRLYFQLMGFGSVDYTFSELEKIDFRVEMAPGLLSLDPAVVSGSRWRQNSSDVPAKISVFSSKNIIIRNPANTADWLGNSGEVFIQKSQQGGGSPMIRGFSANRLLYAVDGVRMNTAIFRSGNLHNVISLDPFAISTTEVLFGPGSVMYGSDAIGGVMSFETLDPSFASGKSKWSGNALSRFASANNEATLHADLSYSSNRWAFLTSISRFDYGDLKMGSVGPLDYLRPIYAGSENGVDMILENPDPEVQITSGYDQYNLMQKVKFKASDRTVLSYGFHYSKSGSIPRYDRLIEQSGSNLRFATWAYGPQIWMMNNFGISHESDSKFFNQMNIKVAQQYFEESRVDRRFSNANQNTRTEKVNAYSVNADFVKSIRSESFFSYGAEVVFNRVNSEGIAVNVNSGITRPTTSRYPNSDWFSAALYSTYHTAITDKVKIQTGLRYNFNSLNADFSNNSSFYPLPFSKSKNNFGAVTGSFGLVIQAYPSFTISPNLSTGFRAPNVDDIGKIFDSEPGAVLVPNPDLKPEYAYNAELNLNKIFGQRFKVNLSGYYTLLRDAMVRRPYTLDGQSIIDYDGEPSQVLAIQNAASAKVYGLQAGFELAISKYFLLVSRYNFQKGTEELEDSSTSPSRHAAPAFGLSRLTFSKRNLKIELTSQYSAAVTNLELPLEEKGKPQLYAKDENVKPYSPNWMIVNLNTTYQLHPALQLMAGVENIGDQRYRPYSSGLAAPGRNFSFSLKASF